MRRSPRPVRCLRSIPVALRMLAVPVPGRLDDGPQLGVAGLPAQLALRLLRGRHQLRRIARSPWPFLDRHRTPGHLFDGPEYLPHTVPATDPEVAANFLARSKFL